MTRPRPSHIGEVGKLVLCAVCLLHAVGAAAAAQDEPSDDSTASSPGVASGESSGALERLPRIFYLKDKDGQLVPVPGMSLEDFRRLWDLDQKLTRPRPSPPPFVIKRFDVRGLTENEVARLEVEVEVSIQNDGWTRVPLRLRDSVLVSNVDHAAGEGEVLLEYSAEGEGLVCWFKTEAGTTHRLVFSVVTRLQRLDTETRFALSAPAALTSAVSLKLPEGIESASYVDESAAYVPLAVREGAVEHRGIGGPIQLVWRKGAEPMPRSPVVMEAIGEVLMTVHRSGRLQADARLTVRSFGGPMKSLVVTMPPGMRWVPQNTVDYAVEPVKDGGGDAEMPVQRLVVTPREPVSGPIEIRLQAATAPGGSMANQWLEAGGFQVVGAARQGGFVNVRVESDSVIQWKDGPNVFRVDLPIESPEGPDVAARFEYVGQPYSLKIQAAPKRTRIDVEPDYKLFVSPRETQLVATLNYSIRGPKAEKLTVEIDGWTIDRVLPVDFLDTELLNLSSTGPLVIPLSPASQPASGELQLVLQAHRVHPAEQEEIDVTLPMPSADVTSPATLAVIPADNVEVSPLHDRIEGLLEETLPPRLDVTPRRQSPLYFRERGDAERGRFVARVRQRRQEVFVALLNQIAVDRRNTQVRQQLTYRVEYEPLNRIVLDVPRQLFESGSIKAYLDDTAVRLNADPVPEEPDSEPDAERDAVPTHIRAYVELFAEQRIGFHQLTLRYTVPRSVGDGDGPVNLEAGLVVPADDQNVTVTNNQLEITHVESVRVELADMKWTADDSEADGDPARQFFATDVSVPSVPLTVRRVEAKRQSSTTVRRIWLQTWLTEARRRDRAVFRVSTNDPELTFRLPRDVELLNVALNGRKANLNEPREEQSTTLLTVNMHALDNPVDHVVEIWYLQPRRSSFVTGVPFRMPVLEEGERTARFFWQIVTPADEYVIANPRELTPEARWSWRGITWLPSANRGQADLETWIGAISADPIPPDTTNQFLFSGYDPPNGTEATMAGRVGIVLLASSLALAAGLFWIYVSAARKPIVVFFCGIVVVSLAVALPVAAQLAAHAAVFGGILSLLALALNRRFSPRPPAPSSVAGSSLLRTTEPNTVQGTLLHQPSDSHATTATAPKVLSGSSVEAKS